MTFSPGGRSLTVIAAAFCLSLVAVAQQARPTGFIVGRVVDADTNRPIGGATVTLAPIQVTAGDPSPLPSGNAGATSVLTDDAGRFLFRGLAPATHGLGATATSYLPGGLGQRRPGGRLQPFVLTAGQRAGDLTIRLWKEAAVSGTVTDEAGAAVADIWVTILRRDSGVRPGQLMLSRTYSVINARTDDRGRYRLGEIEPGDYVVSVPSRLVQLPATPRSDPAMLQSLRDSGSPVVGNTTRAVRLGDSILLVSYDGMYGGTNALAAVLPMTIRADGRAVGYPATFHPGATAITGATTLTLEAGDDRSNVDIQLRPVPMVPVSGTLVGPDGPASHFGVHLVPAFAASTNLEHVYSTALTTTDATGAFSFAAVPPGQYVLKAWRRPQGLVSGRDPVPPADSTLWAHSPLTVSDTPVSAVVLTLKPGGVLTGRVRFEGTASPPTSGSLQPSLSVAFEPAWPLAFGNRLGVHVSPALEFTTLGLPPGNYFASLPNQFSSSLRGWFFESATLEGRDLVLSPIALDGQRVADITITFSDRRSELTGVVLDRTGRPDAAAAVLIFPADYRSWIAHGLSTMAARAELASQTGTFAVPLRPGAYLVAAVDEEALRTWTRPGAIEAIVRGATPVSIARGDSKRVELRRGAK